VDRVSPVSDRFGPRNSRKGRLVRPFCCGLLALALMGAATSSAVSAAEPGAGRLRPPPLACDRNHLTSWRGRVIDYHRQGDTTWLQIATDDDTQEEAELKVPPPPAAPADYRLDGQAFTADDWSRIEMPDGTLRAGMRATAWVCEDGATPTVIDWQPPAG